MNRSANRVRPGRSDRGADDPQVGAGEDGVERGGELAVPVADQEPEPIAAIAEVHQQVAGLLGDPGAGGVGGDPRDVHAAAVVFDDDEDVEAAQERGVDVGEVDREDGMGLRGEELSPGRTGPSGRGIEARVFQDLPDGRGGNGMAEADQLVLNSSVAPAGILTGHPQHEGPDRRCGGWGLVVGAGRSSGGRRAGRASAAAFGATPAVAGAVGQAAACSVR